MNSVSSIELPGLDCGVCGFRKCADLAIRLETDPELIKRCIHLSEDSVTAPAAKTKTINTSCAGDSACPCAACPSPSAPLPATTWLDSLGREVDFYLEHFPEDPGPREIIIPHNPMITREMEIAVGDILIGRPLGMSCGCPITHCGVVTSESSRLGLWSASTESSRIFGL